MPTRATKPAATLEDLLPPLLPEGPELDALIKAAVEEALADPRPDIPTKEVFEGLRRRHAERVDHGPYGAHLTVQRGARPLR